MSSNPNNFFEFSMPQHQPNINYDSRPQIYSNNNNNGNNIPHHNPYETQEGLNYPMNQIPNQNPHMMNQLVDINNPYAPAPSNSTQFYQQIAPGMNNPNSNNLKTEMHNRPQY